MAGSSSSSEAPSKKSHSKKHSHHGKKGKSKPSSSSRTKKPKKSRSSKKSHRQKPTASISADEVESLVSSLRNGESSLEELRSIGDGLKSKMGSPPGCENIANALSVPQVYLALDQYIMDHLACAGSADDDATKSDDPVCRLLYHMVSLQSPPLQSFVFGTVPTLQTKLLELRSSQTHSPSLDALLLAMHNVHAPSTPLESLAHPSSSFNDAHAAAIAAFGSRFAHYPLEVRMLFYSSCQRMISQGYPFSSSNMGARISLGVPAMQRMVECMEYSLAPPTPAKPRATGKDVEEVDDADAERVAALGALEALHARATYDLVVPIMLSANALLHLHHSDGASKEHDKPAKGKKREASASPSTQSSDDDSSAKSLVNTSDHDDDDDADDDSESKDGEGDDHPKSKPASSKSKKGKSTKSTKSSTRPDESKASKKKDDVNKGGKSTKTTTGKKNKGGEGKSSKGGKSGKSGKKGSKSPSSEKTKKQKKSKASEAKQKDEDDNDGSTSNGAQSKHSEDGGGDGSFWGSGSSE